MTEIGDVGVPNEEGETFDEAAQRLRDRTTVNKVKENDYQLMWQCESCTRKWITKKFEGGVEQCPWGCEP